MKISIITVAYNAEKTIEGTIQSVAGQDYSNIEYLVVDGASKDGTLAICDRHQDTITHLISEPDKGIYDAMNKGLAFASGDYVGILNSDDLYAKPNVISEVVAKLIETGSESLYGDLVMVDPDNLDRIVRYYSAKNFTLKRFEKGDMPPHPTFFVRRSVYEKYGNFKTHFKIGSDFDLMLRFLYIHKISTTYLPLTMVRMRTGGVSSAGIKNTIQINREIMAALKENKIPTSLLKIYSKYFTKVFQFVRRPKEWSSY